MVPPLTLCAYMKKGPNLRWSLIQCSGGDEGDRTPDLLTASQALSQLSYAPVREVLYGNSPGDARTILENFAIAARAAIRPTAVLPAPGPLPGPIALPPTRRFQNHAGLRGQAGNPRACRHR